MKTHRLQNFSTITQPRRSWTSPCATPSISDDSSPPLPPPATPAPLPIPNLRFLVDRLNSRSLVIKSRVRSCILSHLPAFSAATCSISAADALLGLLSPGDPPPPPSPSPPSHRTSSAAAPPLNLLRSLARNALSLYFRLAAAGDPSLRPDNFTYVFAVSTVSAGGGSPIPVVSGFQGHAFVGSALVGFYLNFSEVGDATKVFDGMFGRDTVA